MVISPHDDNAKNDIIVIVPAGNTKPGNVPNGYCRDIFYAYRNRVCLAKNHILDIAIPEFRLEGGTMIVPGPGRLCDSADVAYYRDMVTVIRDRIRDQIRKGKSLEEVKAAALTKDYDGRYGSPDSFIEAAYKSLKK